MRKHREIVLTWVWALNKWDCFKLNIFWTAKKTTKSKKATNKCEKYLQTMYLMMGLIDNKIYKELVQLNNLIKKWAKHLNGHFLNQDIKMANIM